MCLRCSPDGPADDDGQEAGDPHQQEGGEEGVDEGGDLEGVLAVEILEGRLQEVGQHDLRGGEQQPDEEDKKVRGDDFCGEPGSFRLKITFNIQCHNCHISHKMNLKIRPMDVPRT